MYKLTNLFICAILLFLTVGYVAAQTVPPPPTNLTVEPMMSNARLQWIGSNEATGYKIYKAVDTSHFIPIILIRAMTNFVDPLVPPGHVYRYYVTAVNIAGESAPSNDVMFVPGMPPPIPVRGFIAGRILDDTTGEPISCVRVRFYTPNGFVYFREARTDTFGYYSMHIDTGMYLVHATKWTYIPEWYDNVLKAQDATPVIVTQGDTSVANFGLTRTLPPPLPLLVSVSGIVTDSSDNNKPIAGAYVVIMRTNRMINMIQNQEGSIFGSRNESFFLPEFGTLLGCVRIVRTDTNGYYLARVPDSLRYVILAFKPGYIPEFYKDKRTPFDADRLFITGDTTGINFDLVKNPFIQNSASGIVKNPDGDGVLSRVVLFNVTPWGLFPIRCTATDTLGNYTFQFLYKGLYFAKAVPFAYYAPAWYDKDTCGTMHWLRAEPFLVDSVTTGIDICVNPISSFGLASISGTVRETTDGDLIQNVTVYAISTSSDQVIGYDVTEDDGKFDIQNLAPGSYKIVVDKEGYNSVDGTVYDVNAANNYTVNDAELGLTSVTVGVKDNHTSIPLDYTLEQNYPNPFNPTTEIKFGLPTASRVNIIVYNILGQQVAALFTGELAEGSHSVTWNGLDVRGGIVGSGVYFYKISANSLNNTSNFTSVRKMMLVK